VDGRYLEQASAEVCDPGVGVLAVESGRQLEPITEEIHELDRMIIDPGQLTVDVYTTLQDGLAHGNIAYARNLPEGLRLTKDQGEVARIREAARISLLAFDEVRQTLEFEPTEKAFAAALENRMKQLGADAIAFETIVASGPNSSRPHAQPSNRIIREGDPVIVDFGAVVDGYHSDVARTIWFGKPSSEVLAIHTAAVVAHDEGVAGVATGATHASIDALCRTAFIAHGYTEKPLHPSGHNVGLAIHERPFLSPYASEPLGETYVITVEPGLYVPGVGGCRVEDMVLVRAHGPEVLSAIDETSRYPTG
jgi:Xaa-Pro aminopeptidase